MKLSFLIKTPKNKKFTYQPRFYNPDEEERKERELRIKNEAEGSDSGEGYRQRISGSFRSASRLAKTKADPSAALIRFGILIFLSLMLVAYFQFGYHAFYGLLLFIPFYLYLKFRRK